MATKAKAAELFDPTPGHNTGQVHAQVCATIRAALAGQLTDAKLDAGIHAQARSLAGVIDRASGLGGRKQETYALAGLHRQLAELLGQVRGRATPTDLEALLRELAEPTPTVDASAVLELP